MKQCGSIFWEEENFDAPHNHHLPFIPQHLIPPLFQTPPKLHMEPHWFLRFLRISGQDPRGGNTVTSRNTPVTLLTNLPASSRSHCHFHLHSEIPGTYVSCSNLDALPVTLSTVMSHHFQIFWITEDIQPQPYLLL